MVVALGAVDRPGLSGNAGLVRTDARVRLDLPLAGVQPALDGYYHPWMARDRRRVGAGSEWLFVRRL